MASIDADILGGFVSEAGGQFVGLQTAFSPAVPVIVWVNPQTNHQFETRYDAEIAEHDVLRAAIRFQINTDTAAFFNRSVSLRVSSLRKISSDLKKSAAEIDSLLVERKKS